MYPKFVKMCPKLEKMCPKLGKILVKTGKDVSITWKGVNKIRKAWSKYSISGSYSNIMTKKGLFFNWRVRSHDKLLLEKICPKLEKVCPKLGKVSKFHKMRPNFKSCVQKLKMASKLKKSKSNNWNWKMQQKCVQNLKQGVQHMKKVCPKLLKSVSKLE